MAMDRLVFLISRMARAVNGFGHCNAESSGVAVNFSVFASAAAELRRLFPGITDTAQARECARTIAGSVGRATSRESQAILATCSDYGKFY